MEKKRSAVEQAFLNFGGDHTETGMVRAKRAAYLTEKKVPLDKDQQQLSLLFPEFTYRDDLRIIPNDLARSALFTITNKNTPRKQYKREKIFHYQNGVSIVYTGTELRADTDELVYLQLLHYVKHVPFGSSVEISVKNLCLDVGWSKNGASYERVRDCVSRLKATDVLFENQAAWGRSPARSLIGEYDQINDKHGAVIGYRIGIPSEFIVLFAGETFTTHIWLPYRKLSAVGRRLADWVCSHRDPLPITLVMFHRVCGSVDLSGSSFEQNARRACEEIVAAGIAERCWIVNGKIFTVRKSERITNLL